MQTLPISFILKSKTIFILSSIAAVMVLCGSSKHDATIEARLQHNIDRCHQDLRARFPIWRGCATNILSALSSANAVTLNTPRVASAAMGRDQDSEFRLYLYWLENTPSVDGAELRLNKTNSTVIITISVSDAERNMKDSEISVVFAASWIWSNTNSIRKKLENIDDVSNLKVRLLRSGKPETDWCPVAFYRLDHWMGSKEVAEEKKGRADGITPPK
jgi:hypothetical protein